MTVEKDSFALSFLLHLFLYFSFSFIRLLVLSKPECSICSTAPCSAWLWRSHRQPWVLQRHSSVWWLPLSQVDTVCTWSLRQSLGDTKVSTQGGLNMARLGEAEFYFQFRKPDWWALESLRQTRMATLIQKFVIDLGETQRRGCCWSLACLSVLLRWKIHCYALGFIICSVYSVSGLSLCTFLDFACRIPFKIWHHSFPKRISSLEWTMSPSN